VDLVTLAGVSALVMVFSFGDKMRGVEACAMRARVTDLVIAILASSSELIKAAVTDDCQLVEVDLAVDFDVRLARCKGQGVAEVHLLVTTSVALGASGEPTSKLVGAVGFLVPLVDDQVPSMTLGDALKVGERRTLIASLLELHCELISGDLGGVGGCGATSIIKGGLGGAEGR
jgi:hypothetical protein